MNDGKWQRHRLLTMRLYGNYLGAVNFKTRIQEDPETELSRINTHIITIVI